MKNIGLILSVFLLYSCGEAPLRFERLESEKTGISFSNDLTETDSFNILKNEYIYNGGGVGVADFNADGLQDLVFVGNHVSTRFYLNKGNLRFEDISDRFDGLTNDQWYSGVSVTDINGDDLPDFYLTSTMSKIGEQRKNKFWVNQGLDSDGLPTYREMAEDYAIADTGYSVHSVFFDYDLDGDLDLYVLNNILNKMVPTNYRPKITDGSSINNDRLYQNTGNGKFIDVTIPAGIVYEGYGLGLAVGDVNKDGYPDLYISNDYASNDLLYINQGDGTFQNESASYLSYQSKFSMGNDISDYNNDGNPDIITVDMLPEAYFRKKQTINGNSYIFYINDEKYGYEHQYTRNMIHRHNGFGGEQMLPFSEIGQLLGVYQTEWSWSPLFADFDNDGDRDLFITNGFPKDLTDKDFTNYQAQVGGFVASDAHMLSRIPVVKVSNYAYESKDGNSFEDKTEAWGMKIPSFSNGASFVDLDNDGDLDYVVNNINEPAFIYRNNTIGGLKDAAHYIRLKLKGSSFNTLAIGARVEIWVDGHYQFMEQSLSRGYISSVEPIVHFGLKSGNPIDSIRVLWPGNKRVTLLKEVMPNQLLAVNEADAQSFEGRIKPENKPAFFTSVQDVLDYTHSEIDYIDFFQNQNILPHKYSQIGPCMAKGDIDNDGKDDLIIGASSDLPTQVFLWRENGFVNTQFSGLTDRKQCQESDLVFVDIDQDGDQDIVSLAGGYTNEKAEEYRHFVYLNKGGSFSKMEINIPPFPASVVRAADVDQDGDLDLFVGARVKKGAFPRAEASYVLLNNNGKFETDASFTYDLGMVTDAVWADVDGDGWDDLVVTREWNSVVLLKNKAGKSLDITVQEAMEGKHGLWSAITSGDFDKDGDIDLMVGNLGNNHRFMITDANPLNLYAVDVDNNGTIDPITTSFWADEQGVLQEYPINFLDEMAAQSPFFKKLFTSYTAFSQMAISAIFNPDTVNINSRYYVNETGSFVLWNEGGVFTWEKLPAEAQLSPIKEMMVRDFNKDGIPDILVAGNDYTYDVSTGYYDANKGLLLLGTANRSFDAMSPAKSGILLNGQVEALLYFEGDTSYLVAGINRKKVAVFKQLD